MGLQHSEPQPDLTDLIERAGVAAAMGQKGFEASQASIVSQVRDMVNANQPAEEIVAFFLGAVCSVCAALGSPWFASGGNRLLEEVALAFARGAMRNIGPCYDDGSPFRPDAIMAAAELARLDPAGSG
jgi:hypothetical protein